MMNENFEIYSPYIESGLIKNNKFPVFSTMIKLFFSRIELDRESIIMLDEYRDKGRIVYASTQTTFTSLYILVNLLRKNGMPVPILGLGFIPYGYQKLSIFFHEILTFYRKSFKSGDYRFVPNHEYIKRSVDEGGLIFSILSQKLFLRQYVEVKTDTIEYLLEIQKNSDVPIFIFPQTIYWNRNPEKSSSFLSSDAIGDRGLFTGLLTIWKSLTPAFVRIGKPINLLEELRSHDTDDLAHLARQVRNSLVEIFNYEKRSILGPLIKTQQEMMERVLYHKNVLDAIQQEMSSKGLSQKKLRRRAYTYFREIAADFSIVYIRMFKTVNDYLFKKIFEGIHYNIDDFVNLREASRKGPVIIVPSHKSHMDYVIISTMLYHNKIIPPHIVAGTNLIFFPMGRLFRKSGAFFMRRTFKGLNLYATVFRQYVKTLVNENYTIEFFIEGTRSRTGKVIHPKMGVLKYLIEAVDEGYNKDLVFVPVTINYDRIMEENSYLKEIKGKEKKSETTSGLVRSRRLIEKKYGGVYIGFDRPFSLNEFREKLAAEKGSEYPGDITSELGYYIVRRINDAVVVTPFAITTAALLNTTARGFTREAIRKRVQILLDYIRTTHYRLSDVLKDDSNIDSILDDVFASYIKDDIISAVELSGESDSLFRIDHDLRARINLYKNSIIHMTLPLNFISLAILSSYTGGKTSRNAVCSEFESIRGIFSREFIYQESLLKTDEVCSTALDYMVSAKMLTVTGKDIHYDDAGYETILFFAGMIQDYIESYLVVLNALIDLSRSTLSRSDLMIEVRRQGVRMYNLNEIECSESLSTINYNNTLDRLIETGVLVQHGEARKASITVAGHDSLVELKNLISGYLTTVKSK